MPQENAESSLIQLKRKYKMPTNVYKDNGSLYLAHFFELCFTSKVTSNSITCKDDGSNSTLF